MRSEYPIFVWWYYSDRYRQNALNLKKQCLLLDLPFYYEEMDMPHYAKEARQIKPALSNKRFATRCGMLWLRDTFKKLKRPIFYLHADCVIEFKPELEIFNGVDVGYSVGERKDGLQIIFSGAIYFNYSNVATDFLDVLAFKCKTIRGERPTEHDLIRTTIFDFSGCTHDGKLIKNGYENTQHNKFQFKNSVAPLKTVSRNYIFSEKGDAYIRYTGLRNIW